MKKMASILGTLVLATGSAMAQNAPEIAFDAVNFGRLPDNMYLGEAVGVAVNSKGHVFVFHRGNTSGPAYGAAGAQLAGVRRQRQVPA